MNKIKLVTDSTMDLTPDEIERYNITVIPLSNVIADTLYIDGVDITREEFLAKMLNSSELPKSSQPSIGAFIDTYESLAADGIDVIAIHLARYFSGTVDTALQAATASKGNISVIDSEFLSRAGAFQVLEAGKLINDGLGVKDIINLLKTVREKTILHVSVVDLENIVKGGRISQFMGGISNFLSIKINFELLNGDLKIINKVRGNKGIIKHYKGMLERLAHEKVVKIGFTHAGLNECSYKILDALKSTFPTAELQVMYASSPIMTHAGKNAFSVQLLTE